MISNLSSTRSGSYGTTFWAQRAPAIFGPTSPSCAAGATSRRSVLSLAASHRRWTPLRSKRRLGSHLRSLPHRGDVVRGQLVVCKFVDDSALHEFSERRHVDALEGRYPRDPLPWFHRDYSLDTN